MPPPIEPQTKYRVSFVCKGKHENKHVQIPEETAESECYAEIRNVLADNRKCNMIDVMIISTDPPIEKPTEETESIAKVLTRTLKQQDVAHMTKKQMGELAEQLGLELVKNATHSQMVKALCAELGLLTKVDQADVLVQADADLPTTHV